jgi:hypothetical protein
LTAVVGVAIAVVAAQPLGAPWWAYADADATYVASGLSLLAGNPTTYLDHPGLPLQQLLELAFGLQAIGSGDGREEWIHAALLDLDRTRIVFRGFAALFYVGGAVLSFALVARLLASAYWGMVAGLLWVGAPGLIAMSIQYRPDVLVAALCLAVAFLIATAARARSAPRYAAAGVLLGFTVLVKLHALGLLVPYALALAVWRPRPWNVRDWAITHRRSLVVVLATWAGLAALLNAGRFPFAPTLAQTVLGVALAVCLAVCLPLADRGSVVGLGIGALAVGAAVPVTLDLRDGLQALVSVAKTATGRNVNEGIDPFSNFSRLAESPLREGLLLLAIAALAAIVGLRRGDPAPVVFFAGAAALELMALARLADLHYFAPSFVVAVPAVLWLLRSMSWAGAVLGAALVALVALPRFQDRGSPEHDFEAFRARTARSLAAVSAELRPGEVALTPSYYPVPDTRWYEVVRPFAPRDQKYPFRFLPVGASAVATARERGLRIRYAVGVDRHDLRALGFAVTRERDGVATLQDDEAAEG